MWNWILDKISIFFFGLGFVADLVGEVGVGMKVSISIRIDSFRYGNKQAFFSVSCLFRMVEEGTGVQAGWDVYFWILLRDLVLVKG